MEALQLLDFDLKVATPFNLLAAYLHLLAHMRCRSIDKEEFQVCWKRLAKSVYSRCPPTRDWNLLVLACISCSHESSSLILWAVAVGNLRETDIRTVMAKLALISVGDSFLFVDKSFAVCAVK